MNASALVQKPWNFCHTLRDPGVVYGDYLEHLPAVPDARWTTCWPPEFDTFRVPNA